MTKASHYTSSYLFIDLWSGVRLFLITQLSCFFIFVNLYFNNGNKQFYAIWPSNSRWPLSPPWRSSIFSKFVMLVCYDTFFHSIPNSFPVFVFFFYPLGKKKSSKMSYFFIAMKKMDFSSLWGKFFPKAEFQKFKSDFARSEQ